MKQILIVIGWLIGLFLFIPKEGVDRDRTTTASLPTESVMKEKSPATDVQHCIQTLSNELKDSLCLTPRRTIQTTATAFNFRIHPTVEKLSQIFRLRNMDTTYRISANLSICQTLRISTLFCRMGQHVYALRKLII